MSLASKLAAKSAVAANPQADTTNGADNMSVTSNDILAQLEAMKNLEEAPPGSYLAQDQHQLILATGKTVKPTNGFYIPTTQEEYDMLEYFDSLNCGLVQKVPPATPE